MLWALLFLFLSQALILPFVSQLKPTQSTDGKWVMICTLQGLQSVNVGTEQTPKKNKTSHGCPACTLSNAINTSAIAAVLFLNVSALQDDEVLTESNLPSAYLITSAFHIRAPPAA